jgi:predicted esterase
MRRLLRCLLFAPMLFAQDPGLVLRTFVSYTQMVNSTDLPPEKKADAMSIGKQAMALSTVGKHGDAMRVLHRGMAQLRGVEWTPALSLAASIVPSLDHAVWEPGQRIELRLKRLYQADPGAAETVKGTIQLRPVRGGDAIALGDLSGDTATLTAPAAAPGVYRLEIGIPPLAQPKTVDVVVAPGLAKRARALSARVTNLKAAEGPALWTVRYGADLFARADRSEISPNIDFARELKYAEELAAELEAGRDPFASRKGDMRRAYLSKVDNTLQPYRVFVPSSYTPEKPVPLVIALHGMGGDENSLFDRYNSSTLKDLGEKYGWIVAAPKGRDSASMYRRAAEQDVLDVIAEVRSAWKVDENRIYALGHSMGGYGSWSIAMNHPHLFAAIAPVAGGGNPAELSKIKHVPQIVFHGDADRTVPVSQSRDMVAAAKKLGTEVEYVEIAGGGHNEVFVPALPRIFEFFAAHAKPRAAAAAGSGQ